MVCSLSKESLLDANEVVVVVCGVHAKGYAETSRQTGVVFFLEMLIDSHAPKSLHLGELRAVPVGWV